MIDDMSPVFDEPWDENVGYAFAAAVDLCRTTLTNRAKAISADLRAERAVTAAIRDSWPSPILELPFGMPYNKAIRDTEADHVMLVVIPRGEDWTVGTVRDGSGDYTNRMDLPEAWAGLSGQELCDAVGADDAVFCHKARFIAVAKSRETAMMMASLALDAAPEPE